MGRIRATTAAFAAALGSALLAPALPALGAGPLEPLAVGTEAPEFASVDASGQPFSLAEETAKGPVLLVFWSIFCGSCREELPILQQEMPGFKERNVRLFAVNLDEPSRNETVAGFAAREGFTFGILFSNTPERRYDIDEIFNVRVTPALYLVGADRKVLFSHYGPLNPEELRAVLEKLPG